MNANIQDGSVAFLQSLESLKAQYITTVEHYTHNTADHNFRNGMTKKKSHKATIASITLFFDEQYGKDDSKLAGWQTLCRDVGVEVGKSITQCNKVSIPILLGMMRRLSTSHRISKVYM